MRGLKQRSSRPTGEDGFTLIELLVVILIIGVLAAIAIPMFLNQRAAAVEATVKSDVKNAATQIETWAIGNPATAVPNFSVTESVAAPVQSGPLGEIKTSDGTCLVITGDQTTPGHYQIAGNNPGSKTGWTYDSNTGGLAACSDLASCVTSDAAQSTPEPEQQVTTTQQFQLALVSGYDGHGWWESVDMYSASFHLRIDPTADAVFIVSDRDLAASHGYLWLPLKDGSEGTYYVGQWPDGRTQEASLSSSVMEDGKYVHKIEVPDPVDTKNGYGFKADVFLPV